MYSLRGDSFRSTIFDKQCSRFVNETFSWSSKLNNYFPPTNQLCSIRSLLVSFEDESILTSNPNIGLMDLVLDKIITE